MQFTPADQAAILAAVGDSCAIGLHGVTLWTVRVFSRYEEIIDSPNQAEIGSSVLTVKLARADHDLLDKSSRYTYTLAGVDYYRRGPALEDGAGFVKLQLTKV